MAANLQQQRQLLSELELKKRQDLLKGSQSQMRTLGFTPNQMKKGENDAFRVHFDSSGRRRICRMDGQEPILGIQPAADGTGITIATVGGGPLYRLAANTRGVLTFGGPAAALGRTGVITRVNITPINAEGGPFVPLSTPIRVGLLQAKRANSAAQLLPDNIIAGGSLARFLRLPFASSESNGVEEDDALGVVSSTMAYTIELVNYAATAFDFTCDASVT